MDTSVKDFVELYDKETNPFAIGYVEDQLYVDLFPYKVKGRERFYQRNHPVQLHPDSLTYNQYWGDFVKKCIEGNWVQDESGTWVFMMPKLFYYANYVVILDKRRDKIHPDVSDLEWIFFTYFLCLDGFSGFEDDDKYTCHRLVERYEKSMDKSLDEETRRLHELNPIELRSIPDDCFIPGTQKFKKFVDPWEYLTRTYLIDDPRGPLGQALYQNERSNGFILGARGIRKSFTVYMGDFLHEWSFGGVTRMEELSKVNNPLLFAMGSGSKDQMQRTINNINGFYDDQPGKYKYDDPEMPDSMGPFYKNRQGRFTVGKAVQHIVKGKNQIIELFGSTVQVSVITPDRTKIVAGDRFRRVYIEEVGFIEFIEEVFEANIDSLRLEGKAVGSWIATGTGGDMEQIRGSKKLFEHPDAYSIFSIPYYWKNPYKKRIGLFIPAQYQKRDFEDENGFIHLDLATDAILKERKKWAETLDSISITSKMMFNPIVPDEMLIPNELSILPKKEAQIRLNEIESFDVFKKFANVGWLEFDKSHPTGVRFDKDMNKKLHPILDYDVDFHAIDSSGAFVMFEPPPLNIPEYMYWVVYDPAAKSGEGTSMHSVIVYKHFLAKDGQNFRDTVVAEWIGRLPTLEQNFEHVIKIAKFYNAKIFPEINVAGFVEWCRTNKWTHLLQRDSYALQKELTPGAKRSYYKAGFQMNQRMKWWALQRYSDWLLEVRTWDEKSGVPTTRGIDYIYSPRILNEIIYYNETDNFDHTSSMLGLMILLHQLDTYKPEEDPLEQEDDWIDPIMHQPKVITRRRSMLENF